jgi:hypothetical protein
VTINIPQILGFVIGIFLLFSILWIGEGIFYDIAPEKTFVAYMSRPSAFWQAISRSASCHKSPILIY